MSGSVAKVEKLDLVTTVTPRSKPQVVSPLFQVSRPAFPYIQPTLQLLASKLSTEKGAAGLVPSLIGSRLTAAFSLSAQ
jgi:hypothetical protein